MHEYPLTLNIIEIASDYASKTKSKVKKINMVIGEASGILGDSICLYFDEITLGGPCEGAEIDITYVKPMLKCKVCGGLFYRKPFSFDCDKTGCDGEGTPTDIGREFYIRSIEIWE